MAENCSLGPGKDNPRYFTWLRKEYAITLVTMTFICRSTYYLFYANLISGRADPTCSPAGGHRRERGSVAGCQLSNTGMEGAGCDLK